MPSKDKDKVNAYTRKHYHANKDYYKKRKLKRQIETKEFLDRYKVEHGCSRCGYNKYPIALDFHHTGNDKEIHISEASRRGWSLKHLIGEIEKCIILCATCHREVTFEESHPPDH